MASEIFTISVEIETKDAVGNLKEVQKELEKTASSAKGINKGFGDGVKNLSGSITGLTNDIKGLSGSNGIGGITDSITNLSTGISGAAGVMVGFAAVAGAATLALIANASAMAAAADDAAELADKLGVNTTQLAALSLAATENGTNVTGLIGTYDRLANALDDAANGNLKIINAFRSLGITQSDLAGKSEKEIAGIVIKNYDALGRSIQATAAVQDILGKSFRDQIPAIKAVATEYKDYESRIAGSVASRALEEAGARQEKAFSNLGIEVRKTKLILADFFTDTATGSATWATEFTKNMNTGLRFITADNLSGFEKFKAILKDFAAGQVGPSTTAAQAAAVALSEERKAAEEALQATKRLREYRGTSTAGGGRGSINPPLVKLVDDKETKDLTLAQARLTEDQKAVIALTKQMDSAFNDLNKTIALNSIGTDAVSQSMADLAYKLYDTGRGTITLGDAFKLVAEKHKLFEDALASSNTRKFNEQVKSLNTDFDLQLKLLTATTEQEREQIRLRSQLGKLFESQRGGATPEQAKQLEEALKSANEQYKVLQGKKIDNSVADSMRDLTEQTDALNFEIENFWSTNKNGIINTNAALKQLEKQIDPEGRGKNISDAQRAQLKNQLEIIESRKAELEVSQKIEDSFKTLGDASTQWALGTEGSIKRVRLALLQLAALQAFKTFAGGMPTGAVGSFFNGILGGLGGARASGGPVDAGKAYLVGEKGPEVVKFAQSGYVIPNHQITSSNSRTQIVMSPNLIIQGSVTGQTELENMFDQFSSAMANETQKFVINQLGQNGILAR